jgi:dihydropyrimidinase
MVHMSTGRGIELAHQARLAGQEVWIETCPQYLTLTSDVMTKLGGRTKFAPPAREIQDLEAVWTATASGVVQVVGSDHAPWPLEKKDLPPDQFALVPFGMPGVETILPLLYSQGVAAGRISLPRMVELLCEQPARIFGLAPRKGAIAVGADADVVLIDPGLEWTVSAAEMHSQAGYTPYEGWTVRGKPVMTMVRGQVVVADGKLQQSAGYGRYLPREAQRA